jgi:hypothetical protein
MHTRNRHCLTTAAAGEMASFSHHDIELYEWAELKADEEDVWSQGTESWRVFFPSEMLIADTKNVGATDSKKSFFSYSAHSQLRPQIDHLKQSQSTS